MKDMTFTDMQDDDLPVVLDIYNHYILTTTTTFHADPIPMGTLRTFIFLDHKRYKAYVIRHRGQIAGFCFLTRFKNLPAYDRTAELGVYLKPEFTRRGLGTHAVAYLEKAAAENGLKTIVVSISGENTASIELFRKLQYEQCAHFRRVGEKWGRAIDVVFFQKSLEDDIIASRY